MDNSNDTGVLTDNIAPVTDTDASQDVKSEDQDRVVHWSERKHQLKSSAARGLTSASSH